MFAAMLDGRGEDCSRERLFRKMERIDVEDEAMMSLFTVAHQA